MLLLIAVVYVLFLLANTFINKPVIKDIGTIALDEINITKSINQPDNNLTSSNNGINFEYKLIGIRAGESDSSVIVKKANKEYLVKLGDSLDNNFEILNDVSGFRNSEMIELAAARNSKIILVHNHPESSHIQEKMEFKNVVQEVKAHLESKIIYLISNGIKESRISIDPGLGFGKNMNDSKVLFSNLDAFCFGWPGSVFNSFGNI